MKAFEVARLRLERAKTHAKSMSDAWNAIPAEEAYGVRARVDPDGNGRLYVVQMGPIPDHYALLFGEMLYQMRSALDACIYQAVIYVTKQNPPPSEGQLEFPLTLVPKEFPRLAQRRIGQLPQNLQDAIEKLQPYNQPYGLSPNEVVTNLNLSLGLLNDLARKDRHRKLHVVGSTPVKLDPQMILPPGVTLQWMKTKKTGILRTNDNLAVFKLDGFQRWSHQVQINPYLVTLPGLDEPPPPCCPGDTFPVRLEEMMTAVNSVIFMFEDYF